MTEYFELLRTVALFDGIDVSDLEPLLLCLGAKTTHYEKGQTIFFSGTPIRRFGVVLSGQIQVVQDDYYGNRTILAAIDAGELVGEAFACAEIESLPVDVLSTTESELLLIDCRRLTTPCTNACRFHSELVRNMLHIVSGKNIALTKKMEITSRRTTREKLLAYLSSEAKRTGSSRFSIPFARQELADYLCVERSAMSAELSKLQSDGVLRFHKNQFELL